MKIYRDAIFFYHGLSHTTLSLPHPLLIVTIPKIQVCGNDGNWGQSRIVTTFVEDTFSVRDQNSLSKLNIAVYEKVTFCIINKILMF